MLEVFIICLFGGINSIFLLFLVSILDRKKVLRHHPDKRKARGEKVDQDNDYFVCISKAYDVLGVPSKRRSYDSVYPEVDDGVPTANEYTKKNFYQV